MPLITFRDGAGVSVGLQSLYFLFCIASVSHEQYGTFLLKKPLISHSNYLFDQTKGAVNESHLLV